MLATANFGGVVQERIKEAFGSFINEERVIILHSEALARRVEEMAKEYHLHEPDKEILLLVIWLNFLRLRQQDAG